MKFGVILFPGSNCEHDCYYAATLVSGEEAEVVWSGDKDLPEAFRDPQGDTCIIIPGGFSYGDYLRCGAIARFAPVMEKVIEYGKNGGKIIGICNGFQILTESGLLPGVLHRNKGLSFICKDIYLKVENKKTAFTHKINKDVLKVPIAHGEGNYYCDDQTLAELEKNGQIIFRYCDDQGKLGNEANPNGSRHNIAGITNKAGNILGMMPHPERCSEEILNNTDGRMIFESIVMS
jgi:phosphoribosylformylglycinamidine synthase